MIEFVNMSRLRTVNFDQPLSQALLRHLAVVTLVKTFLFVGEITNIKFHTYSPTYFSPTSKRSTGQNINELENGPSSYRQKGIYFEWVFM